MTARSILGSGCAPARAFGGGTELVATPVPANDDGNRCRSTLPHTQVRCIRERGAHPEHIGGGWVWDDEGRYDRNPRLGGKPAAPLVFAACAGGTAYSWSCRCTGCRARWAWIVARACGRVR